MEYIELTEKDKIPLRIKIAEKLAKDDLSKGIDLAPVLIRLVEEENYCGAEGIKRALANCLQR